jgi:hypothetical protein
MCKNSSYYIESIISKTVYVSIKDTRIENPFRQTAVNPLSKQTFAEDYKWRELFCSSTNGTLRYVLELESKNVKSISQWDLLYFYF